MHTRSVLTLVFDDGYTEVFERVLPLLQRYDMRAVFAVPVKPTHPSMPSDLPMTPLAQWKEQCTREGYELAAHGVTHRALTSLSDAELNEELRTAHEATHATTLVYPGGAYDPRVSTVARRYFHAARTTVWGMESFPPLDPFALRTFNATQKNFRWWKYGSREIIAAITGGWVIETFHRVTDRPVHRHDVSLHDFEWHLRWLRVLPLKVMTIQEALKHSSEIS